MVKPVSCVLIYSLMIWNVIRVMRHPVVRRDKLALHHFLTCETEESSVWSLIVLFICVVIVGCRNGRRANAKRKRMLMWGHCFLNWFNQTVRVLLIRKSMETVNLKHIYSNFLFRSSRVKSFSVFIKELDRVIAVWLICSAALTDQY